MVEDPAIIAGIYGFQAILIISFLFKRLPCLNSSFLINSKALGVAFTANTAVLITPIDPITVNST